VRVRDVGKEIDELAASIRKVGLLEPILVAPGDKDGTYEILTGQRRFLAHQKLGMATIRAAIIPEPVDETTAKIISVTENLVRRDLNNKDLIDACTSLYRKYGSVRHVADETGLPYHKVAQYVKYERLVPELKKLVTEGIELKVALKAQDAASVTGECDTDEAVKFAKEMSGMSGAQQEKLVKDRRKDPEASADDIIEDDKSGGKLTQVIVTMGAQLHRSLQSYAKDEGTTQDEAARDLINQGLTSRGYE